MKFSLRCISDYIHTQIRNCDLFGKPISLKFNGQDTFNTVFGGICTLLMILAVAGYFWSVKSINLIYFLIIFSYSDRAFSILLIEKPSMYRKINFLMQILILTI